MKYCVAIKLSDYSQEFSFNTENERQEFVAVTQALHPEVEFILSEAWSLKVAAA